MQRGLHDPEVGACASLVRLKHKYKLSREHIESSPVEEDLGMLVDEKLNTTWPCALTAQKINPVLGYIKSSMASRLREEILPW